MLQLSTSEHKIQQNNLFSLSLIPGQEGGSPPQSVPGSPRGVVGPCWTVLPARRPFWPAHELNNGGPGALPSRQRRCIMDRWHLSTVTRQHCENWGHNETNTDWDVPRKCWVLLTKPFTKTNWVLEHQCCTLQTNTYALHIPASCTVLLVNSHSSNEN